MNGDYCSCGERKKNSNKRLIDADELLDRVRGNYFYFDISGIIDEMLSDKDDEAQTPHYRDPHFATQGGLAMTNDEIVRALRCCGNTDTKKPDCEHCPLLSTRMCVKVMLEGAASLIESQQAQLAESQRRERAAVEDMESLAKQNVTDFKNGGYTTPCRYCKKFDTCDYIPTDNGCCFAWRGPQEAEKGESK